MTNNFLFVATSAVVLIARDAYCDKRDFENENLFNRSICALERRIQEKQKHEEKMQDKQIANQERLLDKQLAHQCPIPEQQVSIEDNPIPGFAPYIRWTHVDDYYSESLSISFWSNNYDYFDNPTSYFVTSPEGCEGHSTPKPSHANVKVNYDHLFVTMNNVNIWGFDDHSVNTWNYSDYTLDHDYHGHDWL